MAKPPSIQFYYKDWLSDHRLKRCSKRAKGVWIDLIAVSCDLDVKGVFSDESGAFDREEMLDLLTGNRKENSLGFDELVKRQIIKQDDDGTFYVKRVKEDAELSEIRREAGKKGGNPALVNNLDKQNTNQNSEQNPTPPNANSNANPSSIRNLGTNSSFNKELVLECLKESERLDNIIQRRLGPLLPAEKKTFSRIIAHLSAVAKETESADVFRDSRTLLGDKLEYCERRNKPVSEVKKLFVAAIKKHYGFKGNGRKY